MFFAAPAHAQELASDHWSPIRFLLGKWNGSSTGQAGEGMATRQYEFIFGERFMRETNTSTYSAQEKNPQGEVHEHFSIFSHDKGRKLIVLRQFHEEGFVNQYVLAPGATATKVVFESENFENFSNKWRARETYEVISPDEFTETFELAPPDKPFETYSKNHFHRVSP